MFLSTRSMISVAAVTAALSSNLAETRADLICAHDVKAFTQGSNRLGGPVDPYRSNPAKALGLPEDSDVESRAGVNFVSLGLGGSITLSFESRIKGSARIVETTYGNLAYLGMHPESAEVFVGRGASVDTAMFWSIGSMLNSQDHSWMSFAYANQVSGFTTYDYLRIVDTTLSLPSLASGDGFDIDGVYAVTVPGPGVATVLALGGMAAMRRRRR